MKPRYVIKRSRLPTQLPLVSLVTIWLLLDRIGIPGWGWGVYWTLGAILVVGCITTMIGEDEVDPLSGKVP